MASYAFNQLLEATGLSDEDAVHYLGVAPSAFALWKENSNAVPNDVMSDLTEMALKITTFRNRLEQISHLSPDAYDEDVLQANFEAVVDELQASHLPKKVISDLIESTSEGRLNKEDIKASMEM